MFRSDEYASRVSEPDMSKYAEHLAVVVRVAPQETALNPEFEAARVLLLDVGADGGEVEFEGVQPTVMDWQEASGFGGGSGVEGHKRHINVGASGAAAVVLVTLLPAVIEGSASGMAELAAGAVLARLHGGRSVLRPD